MITPPFTRIKNRKKRIERCKAICDGWFGKKFMREFMKRSYNA